MRDEPAWIPPVRVATQFLGGLLGLAFLACGEAPQSSDGGSPPEPKQAATFVGATACAGCHSEEHRSWRGSHHDHAMQEATPQSVLGNFDDVSVPAGHASARFFRRGPEYFVHTAGPDGVPADHRVVYTFGVEPLQQYLVELPGGRLQALTLAWDSRTSDEGGQRWFSLRPDEDVPPGDVTHWTGAGNSWNSMCAHCHSTNLRKNFDLATQTFDTTWSELDVACEACHGPASLHVAWAEEGADPASDRGIAVDLGEDRRWVMDADRGIARREPARTGHSEVETCAPCHSRRSLLSEEPTGPFADRFALALLSEDLYFPDGQIDDEVYVYGSFLQSRMYAAGVTCSDCHDPHSLELKGMHSDASTTDAVCAQCHAPSRFATPEHHHHPQDSAGARCVECHMPDRVYMEIDPRRDHSFRVPRPDLSDSIGTPNACSGCHDDQGAKWAAEQISAWNEGANPPVHFGTSLEVGRRAASGSEAQLLEVFGALEQPAIARATALELLAMAPQPPVAEALSRAVQDEGALVRAAAARAAESFPLEVRYALVGTLLSDPNRAVRIEAARVLAGSDLSTWPPSDRGALASSLDEYRAMQELAADLPQSHVNLGLLNQTLGEPARAEDAYRQAIRIGDYFVPAYVNLADLYRSLGRDAEGEPLLRTAVERAPESAEAHQALGLWLVRQRRLEESLAEFQAAAALAEHDPRYAYLYGVALHSTGHTDDALRELAVAQARHPADVQLLVALATISRDAGRFEDAVRFARRLEEVQGGDASVTRLRVDLERACAEAGQCPP